MTTNDDQNTGKLPSKISRRTLAAGAAWSVPVIAVASAAPAYALSQAIVIEYSSSACKHPGGGTDKWYHFTFRIRQSTGSDIKVKFGTMTINGETGNAAIGAVGVNEIDIPGDGVWYCLDVCGGEFGNSANAGGSLEWEYQSPSGTNPWITGETVTIPNLSTPPCQQIGEPKDFPHPSALYTC